jgi:nucleotide-binding universal stress UspA family protein
MTSTQVEQQAYRRDVSTTPDLARLPRSRRPLRRGQRSHMTPQHPRILRAVSGSAASRRAAVIAADLASTFNAQLTILHVVAPVEYRVGRLAPTLPVTRQLDDPLTSPVLLDARRLAWAHGASAETVLIAGDPAPVIVTVAGELGADVLVIGSRPRLLPNSPRTQPARLPPPRQRTRAPGDVLRSHRPPSQSRVVAQSARSASRPSVCRPSTPILT